MERLIWRFPLADISEQLHRASLQEQLLSRVSFEYSRWLKLVDLGSVAVQLDFILHTSLKW